MAGTASLHGADVLSRLNAFALRGLRREWLFKSSLNRDLKDRILKTPLCNGSSPEGESIEFVAPIVGPILQQELDNEYLISKKSEQVQKKSQPQKRPASQSASSYRGSSRGGFKKQRGQDRSQQNQRSKQYQNKTQNQRPTIKFNTSGRGRGKYSSGRSSDNRGGQQNKQNP